MKQLTKYVYEVAPREGVTLIFTANGVDENCVAVSVDEESLVPNPPSPPTFKFTATKSKGQTHFGKIECSFPGDTPQTASFTSRVKGSVGGDFEGPSFTREEAESDIEFRVV